MTKLRMIFLLLAILLGATASGSDCGRKAAPLYSSDDLLEVTIRGPFTTIMKERSTDDEQPATLTYNDTEAGEVTVELNIRTRGRFRRQSRVCKWAPLRLNFKKSTVKETEFAGADKMKLVTHCRNGSQRYTQALLSEYLAYRIFNTVTDASFRVRLLRVTYVDTDKDDRERTELAFMIEHKEQLAKRIGLELNETQATEIALLDARHTNLTSLYQYLIGNTDFSPIRAAPGESCCHNYMLFGTDAGRILPIPYDFDMSGIVDAPHSEPNEKFGLRNVRQRLYRGRCRNNEHVAASVQAFQDKRSEIYELINANDLYTTRTRRDTLRFLDDFYAVLSDPQRVQSKLVDECLG
jgi:hypothetical protein